MVMHLPPEPGQRFTVPQQAALRTIAQKIASFRAQERGEAFYMVEDTTGERWMVVENERADGPPWVGYPPRRERTQ